MRYPLPVSEAWRGAQVNKLYLGLPRWPCKSTGTTGGGSSRGKVIGVYLEVLESEKEQGRRRSRLLGPEDRRGSGDKVCAIVGD